MIYDLVIKVKGKVWQRVEDKRARSIEQRRQGLSFWQDLQKSKSLDVRTTSIIQQRLLGLTSTLQLVEYSVYVFMSHTHVLSAVGLNLNCWSSIIIDYELSTTHNGDKLFPIPLNPMLLKRKKKGIFWVEYFLILFKKSRLRCTCEPWARDKARCITHSKAERTFRRINLLQCDLHKYWVVVAGYLK